MQDLQSGSVQAVWKLIADCFTSASWIMLQELGKPLYILYVRLFHHHWTSIYYDKEQVPIHSGFNLYYIYTGEKKLVHSSLLSLQSLTKKATPQNHTKLHSKVVKLHESYIMSNILWSDTSLDQSLRNGNARIYTSIDHYRLHKLVNLGLETTPMRALCYSLHPIANQILHAKYCSTCTLINGECSTPGYQRNLLSHSVNLVSGIN